jgi:hypothetical protein
MSPFSAIARMHYAPAPAGRMPSRAGDMTIAATIITTGTGTTGNGWTFVRE